MEMSNVLSYHGNCWSMLTLVAGILTMTLAVTSPTDRKDGSIHEYCQDESFSASCNEGETIMMTSARYGRMNLGRCVKRGLGFLGCTAGATRFIDSRCSGHRYCDVSIMDTELRALVPCPADVTWHLEASYDCLRVVTRSRHECHQRNSIKLKDQSGLLSSEIAMTTGVGSPTCPWEIEAPSGQLINITLYNFVYNSLEDARDHVASSSAPCVIVARLGEKSATKSIAACGNDPRISVAYISKSNRLTVSFPGITSAATSTGSRTQFLLQYQLVGCPDISSHAGTVVSRTGNTVEVKCSQTGETWFLTCEGTKWSGILGNCSRSTAQSWAIGSIFQNDENFPFGILIVVAVGVALGIFLGGTLLLVVSVYMKRRRRLQEARAAMHDDVHGYHTSPEDYYRKQELTEFDNKEDTLTQQSGRMPIDDYKITEYRPPFSPSFPPPPRNVHHVYESPKFT